MLLNLPKEFPLAETDRTTGPLHMLPNPPESSSAPLTLSTRSTAGKMLCQLLVGICRPQFQLWTLLKTGIEAGAGFGGFHL
jgi:hypothetical protein